MWLADDDVRDEWPNLVKFLDTWDRSLANAGHPLVSRAYHVREHRVRRLYHFLQVHESELRARKRAGKPNLVVQAAPLPPISDRVEGDGIKAKVVALVDGYDFKSGNISPDRLRNFAWIGDDEDGNVYEPRFPGSIVRRYLCVTEDDEFRDLILETVERSRGSMVSLTLE